MPYIIRRSEGYFGEGKTDYVKQFHYAGYGRTPAVSWTPAISDAHTWAEKSGAYKLIRKHLLAPGSTYNLRVRVMKVEQSELQKQEAPAPVAPPIVDRDAGTARAPKRATRVKATKRRAAKPAPKKKRKQPAKKIGAKKKRGGRRRAAATARRVSASPAAKARAKKPASRRRR